MPVYQYVCEECGLTFEKQVRFSQNGHIPQCPKGHGRVHKVFHVPAVIFKGSGWYSTDHRRNKTDGEDKGNSDKSG
jgi:putative FmdB family regulatory protein